VQKEKNHFGTNNKLYFGNLFSFLKNIAGTKVKKNKIKNSLPMHQQSVIEVHIPAKSIDFEREKKTKTPWCNFTCTKKKILTTLVRKTHSHTLCFCSALFSF